MTRSRLHVASLAVVPLALLAPSAWAEQPAEQQFLFVLDPAYVQEQGEWQLGASLAIEPEDELDFEFEVEVEYGLTDRVQVQASLPYFQGDETSGIGDASIGMTYALVREVAEAPAVSVAVEALVPVGEADAGFGRDAWGWRASLAASKQVLPGVFAHASLGHERTDGARDGAEEADVNEWNAGLGVAWEIGKSSAFTLEFERAREQERSSGGDETEYESVTAIGYSFQAVDGLELGVGAVTQFADGENTTAATIRALFEW